MLFFDRLINLVTGLGQGSDKAAGNVFGLRRIDDAELAAMHRSDWLSRKIIDIVPNDMTREWRNWQAAPEQIAAIEALETAPAITLRAKVNEALRRARLFGGSALFLGMRDGTPDLPLDVERVGAGDLLYLHVLNRQDVATGELDRDVTSPFYGEPSFYEVRGGNGVAVRVHPSRMVRFTGAPVLDGCGGPLAWGDSVLHAAYDAIQNAASAQSHIASLIPELKTDIIYVPGLSKHLQNEATTKALTERFSYANMLKSMFRLTLLEGNGGSGDSARGEKWEQKQINFAQLPELMQQYLQIAAGAADIPVTRLLGQSPAGLNSTGDGDIRNYYDHITARQRTELAPRLGRLDEVLIRSATGTRDPAIHYTWAPLWGLSESERADVFKTTADAARVLAGSGAGTPPLVPVAALSAALVNRLIEDGVLPGLEAALADISPADTATRET
ncbi:hypothetical protein AEAC466_13415 [Asticcacaulis sp. AC466]|uniref:DUF1073 domain-containing protein n=1 Tax=Asticcacaulis sp. AC466 TaxID=1282362 RepID=UPI0003C407EC|nr:DUF1073 domain-containing protein [Asticcacaulis sp. AC466]ESQ83245.1 hypothetical protein AEAC466_13415 [Asticcacaulis sp. AC466]